MFSLFLLVSGFLLENVDMPLPPPFQEPWLRHFCHTCAICLENESTVNYNGRQAIAIGADRNFVSGRAQWLRLVFWQYFQMQNLVILEDCQNARKI